MADLMKKIKALSGMVIISAISTHAFANESKVNIEQKTQSWSVNINTTRIIYHPESSGAVISISNPNNYPVLVQGSISPENKSSAAKAPFIITPPLFRLNASQQSQVRVVMTENTSPKDRESLYWLCETAIPPELGDAWAEGSKPVKKNTAMLDVRIRLSQCIKLLVRPDAVTGTSADVVGKVTWSRMDNKLVASNPTPFYMNLEGLYIGGTEIKSPNYIPPMGTQSYPIPKGGHGDVSWKIINDLGGLSTLYKASVK
ncbi:fimbria/pilus periplasmic chaperone [Salmonella enterica subsp. enterica]|nr:fimbria/pilus periplasmic chaperone [Salmonella enterica subsp. enterica serovar Birkenhead]QGK33268.1 fimbria/pilus periplasmic chaperone [Salmonella enterica subsp. enterica serovar Birkenhead]